jgi:hypothetical protein
VHVAKHHRDLPHFALDALFLGQYFFRQPLRQVALDLGQLLVEGERCRHVPGGRRNIAAAFAAEKIIGLQLCPALRAGRNQTGPALAAKLLACAVFGSARGALHGRCLQL